MYVFIICFELCSTPSKHRGYPWNHSKLQRREIARKWTIRSTINLEILKFSSRWHRFVTEWRGENRRWTPRRNEIAIRIETAWMKLGARNGYDDDKISGKFYRCRMNKPIKRKVLSSTTQWLSYLYVNKVERERERVRGRSREGKRRDGHFSPWSWCNLREDWR